MGFIDDRFGEFWNWFTQDLSNTQRTTALAVLLAWFAVMMILGDNVNKYQVRSVIVLVLGIAWFLLWRKFKKTAVIVLAVLLLSCSVAAYMYFTAAHRRARNLIAEAQELKKQGQYESSLKILEDVYKLLTISIKDHTAGPEAALCLIEMSEVEIITGKWEQAETHLNETNALWNITTQCDQHADVSLWLGEITRLRGNASAASQLFSQALDEYKLCNNAKGQAASLVGIGKAASIGRSPNYEKAMASCEAAARIYASIASKVGSADVLISEGDIQHNRGEYGQALSSYLHAQKLYREEKFWPGQTDILLKLGDLYSDQAFWDAARSQYEEASIIAARIQSRWRRTLTEGSLGDIEQKRGYGEVALSHYREAMKDAEAIHWDWGFTSLQVGKGYAEIHVGKFADAKADLETALNRYRTLGLPKGEAQAQIAMGELSLERKDFPSALGNFTDALSLLLNKRDDLVLEEELQAKALRGLAEAERNTNRYAEANGHYQGAFKLYAKHGNKQGQASIFTGQGCLEQDWHHDVKKAADLYEQALQIYQDKNIDDRRGRAGVCKVQGDLLSKVDVSRAREKYLVAYNDYQSLGDKTRADELEPLIR
jgi:tetratricopeptide (TPR) repeat protein